MRKMVPKVTCSVLSGMLHPTVLLYLIHSSLKFSVWLCGWQSNPYIDDEAEDEDDDDDDYDDNGSDNGGDSEKDGDDELSDAENVEGPEAGDADVESAESLHLHLDTEDVEDTQCECDCLFPLC